MLSSMEREDMDKSAYPTPKMDTVPTPAAEPDPEPEPEPGGGTSGSEQGDEDYGQKKSSSDIENRLEALENRLAAIELKTEGNLNVGVHGDYHKTVHGNSQTTVLGGSNQRVSGGRAVSVAGASVSTVGGSNVNVTGVAKGCISATRWVASGLDVKAVGVKSESYVSKFENGSNTRLATISRGEEISEIRSSISYLRQYSAVNARSIAHDCNEINKARRAFSKLVQEISGQKTFLGHTRLENIKRLQSIAEITEFT